MKKAKLLYDAMDDVDKAMTLLQHAQQKVSEADFAPSSDPFNNELWTAETILRSTLKRMGKKLKAVKEAELAASQKNDFLGYDRLSLLSQFIAEDEDLQLNKRDFLAVVVDRISDDIGEH